MKSAKRAAKVWNKSNALPGQGTAQCNLAVARQARHRYSKPRIAISTIVVSPDAKSALRAFLPGFRRNRLNIPSRGGSVWKT